MLFSIFPVYKSYVPLASQSHVHHCPTKIVPRCLWKRNRISCWDKRKVGSVKAEKNYYELLGVSVDSSAQQIKEAYRKLQKRYHPDIAGKQSHEYTLMLNEAYKVLVKEDLRKQYDASIGQMRTGVGNHVMGFSSWKGPLRPQALFVDENACIGCRECVHHANNTFVMDESVGCARVKLQYGDVDQKIEVSVDSCPVNCIHWVEREDLAILEFLIQPRPKHGNGVFGQGWERPVNVFMAAKTFKKKLQQQTQHQRSRERAHIEEETPAQAEARANASMKIKMERFPAIEDLLESLFGNLQHNC